MIVLGVNVERTAAHMRSVDETLRVGNSVVPHLHGVVPAAAEHLMRLERMVLDTIDAT